MGQQDRVLLGDQGVRNLRLVGEDVELLHVLPVDVGVPGAAQDVDEPGLDGEEAQLDVRFDAELLAQP